MLKIAIMSLATLGWMTHNLWLFIAVVVSMGLPATLFGSVKYAYLPQQFHKDELIGGNGVIEMGIFVGILLSKILGAVLVVHNPWGIELVAGGTIFIAIVGWLFSRRIPLTSAPELDLKISWNPLTEMVGNLRFSRQNRLVFLGNAWF